MTSLVSIAIATFNGEKFLEEQLDSIYAQTYTNFEVVVSDDGSTDETLAILTSYKEKFGLRYFINPSKLGVTKNFENAIVNCEGDYILLSDQDDIWMPQKIERLLESIGDFSLIYSDGLLIDEEGTCNEQTISGEKWIKPFGIDSSNQYFMNYLLLNSFILGCSMMFKREILAQALPFYQSNLNHDWWLAVCAQKNNGVKYIDQPLIKYRIHTNNFSMIESRKRESNISKFLNFYSSDIKEKRKWRKRNLRMALSVLSDKMHNSFIDDMKLYCFDKGIRWGNNLNDFIITYKHQKFFFPTLSFFRKNLRTFTTLFQ